ncbi:MAG: cell division/cell wall cluster transcriptional repressor MraZ [Candidatus Zambryskibacteria bacterium RIFCSPHIGHO2_12_FULL_38_34]|uniref:Transcriptional regulator MraZ n=1 Tax=Candidatus Zambryskibacteria bacterium RIFCSPLOWO2_12_FULL_39_16 TaxID=1802775 RepID=A0A1G2USV2_9BACT|nr:MAG: cell division/cell wall cluster transcriptional repressor MraZ [Candidatus Zambryskibacteria bacterium RIFCSPHIGHO2_02_FULL_38_22]OHA98142.1 MAG: cell division/cell wall cluster transcriptional repressor MraZ [Candidatus Zambryskibacteria bacterium RIFCSPHIGHO2_12_FULL_38_34]OHB07842.1 MAG: cell division/cell wall cluster transcriptional repressor MraZ [Candidatus Zambryskibacteria bacterium RIFCSPLOWO2_02_FULL_38_13]OHB12456.1 MAG: cell division/cell wall cluster transcriptional repress
MLIGEYTHTIDDKNRVSLPSKIRSLMGKKIVITYGLDQCLFAFTLKEWQRIAEKFSENSSMLSSDMRSFSRHLFGGASEVDVDNIGRVLIPDFLRESANLKTKVVLIGVQNRLEIWNEKSWTDYKKQVEKQADGLAEKLSGLGIM